MKKNFLAGVLAGGLLFGGIGVFAGQYAATENSFPVQLNGENISLEGYNIEGSTYFKLRDIADTVGGFDVGFNNNTIQLSKGGYVYSDSQQPQASNNDIRNIISAPLDTDEEVKNIYYPSLDYYKIGNFYFTVNSAGGINMNWCANILSDKTIKYINMTVRLYNAVDDRLSDEISGESEFNLKITGPLNKDVWLKTQTPFAYADTCAKVSIDEMSVEFTDGTIVNGVYGYSTNIKR